MQAQSALYSTAVLIGALLIKFVQVSEFAVITIHTVQYKFMFQFYLSSDSPAECKTCTEVLSLNKEFVHSWCNIQKCNI